MTEDQTEAVVSTEKQSENASIEPQNQTESPGSNNPFKTDKKPPKRKKLKKLAETEESQTNENEEENGMPAPPPSKRQKKKQKQQQNIVRNKDKEIEKTISYLVKWDTSRDEWKYEKLRQIFIQKNVFDEKVIDTEHCDVAIKYLATSKGHSRAMIIESAEAIIKEIETKITDENQEELTSSARYERARQILQSMDE
ncbi:uncharacterized protein C7orf50 [Contarinia nasturtii]|uniref:uncharacterized protein C7orf50 n=1 Tax=Contarinia nasturtii TaxID=265458 RepID=UPI0012D41FAA|nr:uncharacterized protein C7orf50 [Contarinia nasturtii]